VRGSLCNCVIGLCLPGGVETRLSDAWRDQAGKEREERRELAQRLVLAAPIPTPPIPSAPAPSLIGEFSHPDFTRAVGHHGELLIESAFARTGFRVRQQKVTAVDGKAWIESGHDLDFLIERDGIRYGVEVKNQLGYIDQDELEIKLAMCERFGVRPMFCVRVMPANYFYDVTSKGGYVLVTQNQNYPLLAGDLARRVRKTLSLPVAVIQRLPDSALARFEKFHTSAG
jgi:hypothetical protein